MLSPPLHGSFCTCDLSQFKEIQVILIGDLKVGVCVYMMPGVFVSQVYQTFLNLLLRCGQVCYTYLKAVIVPLHSIRVTDFEGNDIDTPHTQLGQCQHRE